MGLEIADPEARHLLTKTAQPDLRYKILSFISLKTAQRRAVVLSAIELGSASKNNLRGFTGRI